MIRSNVRCATSRHRPRALGPRGALALGLAASLATGIGTSIPRIAAADPMPPGAPMDPYGPYAAPAQPQGGPINPYGYDVDVPPPAGPPGAPMDPYGPYAPHSPALLPPLPGGCSVNDCYNGAYLGAEGPYRATPPTVERHARYGLIAAGVSVLGGLWVLSASSAVLSGHGELAIPLAGPILTAVDLNSQYSRSIGLQLVTGVLLTDTLFQTVGLVMAIAGGASRVTVVKRHDPQAPTIAPYGAGVSGKF